MYVVALATVGEVVVVEVVLITAVAVVVDFQVAVVVAGPMVVAVAVASPIAIPSHSISGMAMEQIGLLIMDTSAIVLN